ncbi:MAG: hypothetical protein H7316_21560 [Tardiphaga sp.]|uniref:hypothetical protein n=1 Tax=Tardiphaga sp. TaxID=1926292 RepID=UPI0019A74703|nr:hypothetical protein [Tardiphaga sp.]MBC7586333.1 hypothetical protein [Tardiphaga sp.]
MNIVKVPPPLADEGLGLVHRNLNWLLSGTDARSAEVHAQLLQHVQLSQSTLVILTLLWPTLWICVRRPTRPIFRIRPSG